MKYRAEFDGDRQWTLHKTVESKIKGEDGRATGETREKEIVVGFFPKVSQVASRMYEGMVADEVGEFSTENFKQVVDVCVACERRIKEYFSEVRNGK